MTCRNQLMNEGKPYPRSGCDVCGSMFSGARVCKMNVQPNPPADSSLGPRHYIDTESPRAEKYGVVIEDSYQEAYANRHGTDYSTIKYNKLIEFDTKEGLEKWIIDNKESFSKKKVVKYIKFNELKAETTITVTFK